MCGYFEDTSDLIFGRNSEILFTEITSQLKNVMEQSLRTVHARTVHARPSTVHARPRIFFPRTSEANGQSNSWIPVMWLLFGKPCSEMFFAILKSNYERTTLNYPGGTNP